MGSDNQEQRPPGLLIDNFHAGNYPAWMLKTAARAAYIENWDFSHWPNIKDVAREDVLAKHGFEIPEPFKSPTEYTARNWSFDKESCILHPDPFNPKIKCRYPASLLFLKHYAYRSFEEFRAYRANPEILRVKSDDGENDEPLQRPRHAWENGWGVHDPQSFKSPCAQLYANDFTADTADRTRAGLAARKGRWDMKHKMEIGGKRGWSAWHARQGYNSDFPPIEDWII